MNFDAIKKIRNVGLRVAILTAESEERESLKKLFPDCFVEEVNNAIPISLVHEVARCFANEDCASEDQELTNWYMGHFTNFFWVRTLEKLKLPTSTIEEKNGAKILSSIQRQLRGTVASSPVIVMAGDSQKEYVLVGYWDKTKDPLYIQPGQMFPKDFTLEQVCLAAVELFDLNR